MSSHSNRTLFFDIETTSIPSFSVQNIKEAEMTCFCGLYGETDNTTDNGESVQVCLKKEYTEEQKAQCIESIGKVLDEAKIIIAFNADAFDLVVMQKYYDSARFDRWKNKCIDPMVTVKRLNQGYPKSLQALATANGIEGKTGDGANAPKLWETGQYDELLDYCLNDVRILQQLWNKDHIVLPAKVKKYEKVIPFQTVFIIPF